MNRSDEFWVTKRRLLVLPPLLISAVSLPMALGLVAPNAVYGFRTVASFSSAEVWCQSNFVAGAVGVVLGVAGALLNHRITRNGPITTPKALLAGAVIVSAALGSTMAGMLAS
jgi:uncharacterized membrane protein